MEPADELFEWLMDGAPGVATGSQFLTCLVEKLRASGLTVNRAAFFISMLHPNLSGRGYIWKGQGPVEVLQVRDGQFQSGGFAQSPLMEVIRTGKEIRQKLGSEQVLADFSILEDLRRDGFTDYFVLPLPFIRGEVQVASFATRHPAGFSEEALLSVRRIARPLARLMEIFHLRRNAITLLSTYVGRNCGDRILSGQIQRGDVETRRAIIWFSDLRGFTELSSALSPPETIELLNLVFECQVPAIEDRGGEVLKFIGDGVLAIFPIAGIDATPAEADSAIEAVEEALAALELANSKSDTALRIGVALHVGELAYGNIGSSSRLDFTAIGSAVNLTARLEGLSSRVGHNLVLSSAIAAITTRQLKGLGPFSLKGVAEAVDVFTLA